MSRPAAGTQCEECRLRGHRCEAQIFVGTAPLCLDCADERPCSADRVAAQAKVEAVQNPNTQDFWDTVDERIHRAKREMDKEKPIVASAPKSAPAKKTFFKRAFEGKKEKPMQPVGQVAPEVARRVLADLATMTVDGAAKKNGVSWYIANKIRSTAGIESVLQHRPGSAPRAKTATVFPTHVTIDPPEEELRDAIEAAFPPEPAPTETSEPAEIHLAQPQQSSQVGIIEAATTEQRTLISIKIEITEEEAISVFSKLSAAHKGEVLQSVMESYLRH